MYNTLGFESFYYKYLDFLFEAKGLFAHRIKENINIEEYQIEYTNLMEKLKILNMETRLCHNDAGSGNFIYNEKEGKI